MYSYRITPLARLDMASAKQYIAVELSAPESANELMQALKTAFENACAFPESIPPVTDPKLQVKEYRKIIVKNYIAFVLLDHENESVDIMRVLYYARNFRKLL